jgi:hypothetical protein
MTTAATRSPTTRRHRQRRVSLQGVAAAVLPEWIHCYSTLLPAAAGRRAQGYAPCLAITLRSPASPKTTAPAAPGGPSSPRRTSRPSRTSSPSCRLHQMDAAGETVPRINPDPLLQNVAYVYPRPEDAPGVGPGPASTTYIALLQAPAYLPGLAWFSDCSPCLHALWGHPLHGPRVPWEHCGWPGLRALLSSDEGIGANLWRPSFPCLPAFTYCLMSISQERSSAFPLV